MYRIKKKNHHYLKNFRNETISYVCNKNLINLEVNGGNVRTENCSS